MYLIHRYFLFDLIRLSVVVTLVVVVVVLLQQSLRLLDILVKSEGAWGMFLALLLALIPTFLATILPLTLGGTILFFYYQKQRTQELIVLRSMGFSAWELGLPAILLGLGVMVLCFYLSLYGQPLGYRWLTDVREEIVGRFSSLLIREGTFTTIVEGLTIYVEEQQGVQSLSQVIIHDQRMTEKDVTFIARTGYISHHGTSIRLFLEDGIQQEYNHATGRFSELSFERYTLELGLLRTEQSERTIPLREMSTVTLFFSTGGSESQEKLRRAELHERFVRPFLVLVFACIGVFTVFYGQYDRRSQGIRLLIGGGVMGLLQALSFGLMALARHHTEILVMSYVLHFLLLFLGLLLLSTDNFFLRTSYGHDKERFY